MFRALLCSVVLLGLVVPQASAATLSDLFGPNAKRLGTSRSVSLDGDKITVVVDISEQVMKVAVDGRTVYTFDVSTGRAGYSTPQGTWKPIRMHEMWYSSKYENSPMPFSIFFHGGYAIHGTGDLAHLGQVASHGCVRLDPADAKKLYLLVKDKGQTNTTITITG